MTSTTTLTWTWCLHSQHYVTYSQPRPSFINLFVQYSQSDLPPLRPLWEPRFEPGMGGSSGRYTNHTSLTAQSHKNSEFAKVYEILFVRTLMTRYIKPIYSYHIVSSLYRLKIVYYSLFNKRVQIKVKLVGCFYFCLLLELKNIHMVFFFVVYRFDILRGFVDYVSSFGILLVVVHCRKYFGSIT